jgi:gliding motility-associated-like protein
LRNDADDSPVGAPVDGTGGTISLNTGPLLATTTFNVLATSAGCPPAALNATATVNVSGAVDPDLAITAAANPICEGDATLIQIANSEVGVDYQLRDDADDSAIGAPVAGTGGTIDLPTGNLTTTTTFNVLASSGACSLEMTTLVTIDVGVSPDPSLAVAVVLDPLCIGGVTDITVALSQVGVDYQLRDDADDSPVGPPVAGTGGTISFSTGVLNATTTFNVLATSVGCPPVELTTLATVTVSGSVDASLLLTAAATPICEGSGTDIQINNSEVGVTYQLRDDATDTPIGAPVAGTGGLILLPTGNLTASTTFNVLATNGVCSIELTDLETVDVDVAPDPGLVVGVTIDPLCIGGVSEITVDLSQAGVMYQLRNDADDSPVGAPVAGTGGMINLSTGVLNVTTVFNVLAMSGVCPPTELTALATVTVGGSVDASLVVTSTVDPICAGGSSIIQVANSEVGVTYQLRDDATDSPVGSAVAGTGGTIDLPTGNLLVTTIFNVLASNGACSIELTDQETITVSPGPALNLSVTPSTALICPGTGTSIIVASSEVGVMYQLRDDATDTPVGSPVAGTGGSINLPTGTLSASTTFNVLATQGSCVVELTNTATVNVRPPGDPACGGGGSDCTNFSSIQPSIVTQPSCKDRDAGEISFSIARTDGTPTTFRVILSINGTNQTKFTSNTVNFDDLSSGLYQYTIVDEGNGLTCGPVDFFLDLSTQVEILDKQVTADVTCFGGTDGNVILTVDGSTTGEYWYRYVLDGVESGGQTFTPGAPLPGGLPADDDDFLIIKVDDNFNFSCPDTVMVRIRHMFPRIDFTVASTNVTTCNGTDGGIQVASIGGGDPGSGPLQVRLKKAVPFSTDPSGYIVLVAFEDVAAGFKEYLNLSQGNYVVDVKDGIDCIQSKAIAVQAPGQVPLGIVGIVATDASCSNEGASGSIQVTIGDAGMFQVALSQDQVNVPPDSEFIAYNSPSIPSITFNNLVSGVYYLYLKSSTTTCPTRTDAITIGGVQALNDFDVLSSCDNLNLTINNITGQQSAPFVIRVFNNNDKFTKIDSLTSPTIPLSNAVTFVYNPPLGHPFLSLPGTYRFVMVQNQTTGVGTCTLVSDTVVYDVRLGLAIQGVSAMDSYPLPKRTGSITVENIAGGTRFISGSNELFYEISLYTADDDIEIFGWEQVKLNPQNKFSKTYEYIPPGVYRIKVRDFAGCVKTQDIEIGLDSRIFVPNIFTPNEDNVNDEFEVLNLPLTGQHQIIISNRWGNEVFTSKDYRVGTFWSGEDVPDGIYYYRLKVASGETFTGWVEVLRGSKP